MSYVDTANAIKGILTEQDVTVDRKDGSNFVFRVKPLSARQFARITKGKNENSVKADVGEGYAVMEDVIIECVVSPKIIRESPDKAATDQISIDSLPMDLVNKIFESIFKISGLSTEEDEETKN